jgi:hypothetical protein
VASDSRRNDVAAAVTVNDFNHIIMMRRAIKNTAPAALDSPTKTHRDIAASIQHK